MKAKFDIFRKKPGQPSYRQSFEIDVQAGHTVLDVFHTIQEDHDPSFAYRYSCRGAICGSCAVRINGEAALACKSQAIPLAEKGTIAIDPLANLSPIKDLVSDFEPFWEAFEKVRPFIEREPDRHDERITWEDAMPARNLDQLDRSIDCIKCASCFSDCPKRAQDAEFIGPAASVTLYKFFFDPRDAAHAHRREFAKSSGAVFACDSYANCVRVCPKDCRPLRAINLIKQDLSKGE
jgi:succinate dehydrogenase / fumarate reductase, iron-sulfur subunit